MIIFARSYGSELLKYDRGQCLLVGAESGPQTSRQFVTVGSPGQRLQAARLHDRPDAVGLLLLLPDQGEELVSAQARVPSPWIHNLADVLEAERIAASENSRRRRTQGAADFINAHLDAGFLELVLQKSYEQ